MTQRPEHAPGEHAPVTRGHPLSAAPPGHNWTLADVERDA